MERIVKIEMDFIYEKLFDDLSQILFYINDDRIDRKLMYFDYIQFLENNNILTEDEYLYFDSFIEFRSNDKIYYGEEINAEIKIYNIIFDYENKEKRYDELVILMNDDYEKFYNKMPYSIFLSTNYWKIISEYKKYLSHNKCQLCTSTYHLNTHHNNYKNKGSEYRNMDDLIILCSKCHSKFHGKDK